MEIKYPDVIYCSNCKAAIHLDYSKTVARTNDLLIMNIEIPHSANSGKDARKNKQDVGYATLHTPKVLICQSCSTILGVYNYARS